MVAAPPVVARGEPMRAPVHELHRANLLTYGALLCAVTASVAHGHHAVAGIGLALAVVADTFDGRFARTFARTDRQQRIGAQLDSLVDAVAFGLAPVMVLAATARHDGIVDLLCWWIAAAAVRRSGRNPPGLLQCGARHARDSSGCRRPRRRCCVPPGWSCRLRPGRTPGRWSLWAPSRWSRPSAFLDRAGWGWPRSWGGRSG